MADNNILEWLFRQTDARYGVSGISSVSEWKLKVMPLMAEWDNTIDCSIVGGFYSDRLAWAFLSGYQSALRSQFPFLPNNKLVAFCVSEKGGSRPKAMMTVMRKLPCGYELAGRKTFVTCADEADQLLIAVNSALAEDAARPEIKVVSLAADAPGLTIEEDKTMPFIPELKRGCLLLDDCPVSDEQVLPGDGYAAHVKPFSPLEAPHIMAAGLGYFISLAVRLAWPKEILEQALSILIALKAMDCTESEAPLFQVLTNGLREQVKALIQLADNDSFWLGADQDERKRWQRDKIILMMGDKAHGVRLTRARDYYSSLTGG